MEYLAQLDVRLTNALRLRSESRFWQRLFSFFAHSGDSWFWLAGLGLVWLLSGTAWHNKSAFIGVVLVLESAFVLALKFAIRRRRPEGEWGAIYRSTDPHSFPSGHASRAALLAVVGLGLGPAWFGWLLLFWAPLVSLARVSMGVHYLSDVLAGIVLGSLIGLAALQIQPWVFSLPLLFR